MCFCAAKRITDHIRADALPSGTTHPTPQTTDNRRTQTKHSGRQIDDSNQNSEGNVVSNKNCITQVGNQTLRRFRWHTIPSMADNTNVTTISRNSICVTQTDHKTNVTQCHHQPANPIHPRDLGRLLIVVLMLDWRNVTMLQPVENLFQLR
jgi:hypothetical protein